MPIIDPANTQRSPAGPTPTPELAWARDAETLARELGADLRAGLSSSEAARRLLADGPNELGERTTMGPLELLLGQFRSFVVWVLIGAAVLAGCLGEMGDALAIGAIVILNSLIGFYQEYHAERAVAALRKVTAPVARVVRNGRSVLVPAAEVVRGDLLCLEAGDLVAADARLIEARSLRTSEAPLTGESEPVEKEPGVHLARSSPLAERTNMVYLGTSVAAGEGRAVVIGTGGTTELGRIAALLETTGREETPLQRRLDRVGRSLLVGSLAIVAVVFVLGLLRGERPGPMLLTAISLAIAAVPEGLPAVVTIALSLGVGRMARRHALIRRLAAVETLGSAQVICSDKTGTLTTGQMTARVLWVAGEERAIEAITEGDDPARNAVALAALTVAAGCNGAELSREGSAIGGVGDPMELALLAAAQRAGISREAIEVDHPRCATLPFDSERKRMTVLRRHGEAVRAYVKGAPDVLLPRCSSCLGEDGFRLPLREGGLRQIETALEAMAGRALRVIAVATRDLESLPPVLDESVERELTFVGLVALQDPPRTEALRAIRDCREAGIRVVMITGDHPTTAAAIAGELGLYGPDARLLTGADVQAMSDAELREQAPHVAAYARVTAEDKLRIVRAFRAGGAVVAMTGDGVNDAPALREASIGVAMGRTGTEVTREAADMVITDDNFASIVAAVEEGRGVYDNIRKCLQYLLAGNTGEILIMLVAALVGWPIPLLPLQILWINLVTDGLPALALAADPVDPLVLQQPPRPPDAELADRPFFASVLVTGVLTAGAALAAFAYGHYVQHSVSAARNYAFSTLVFAELLRSFGARSHVHTIWQPGAGPNHRLTAVVIVSILLQVVIHHLPFLQRLFDLEPLGMLGTVALLLLGAVPLLLLELYKLRRAPDHQRARMQNDTGGSRRQRGRCR